MARTVIVADVHGCRHELELLLSHLQFSRNADRLVLVGDLIARGPDSHGVLATVQRFGGRAVRGNHENKLLAIRAGASHSGEHGQLAAELSEQEWSFIEAMPLWLDLPEHQIRVVHAGVLPGKDVATTAPEALFTMRAIDARGHWSAEKTARPFWGERYTGPPHVVFGHNAMPEPQFHPWATGIDTGSVYGGRLTAVVLEANEPLPRASAVQAKLVSVPARRAYFEAKGGFGTR